MQALVSTDAHSHMKLYFNHFIVLSNTLQKVISAQGFCSRLDQYEAIKPLPESLLGESWIVKQKTTNQIYELSAMNKENLTDE